MVRGHTYEDTSVKEDSQEPSLRYLFWYFQHIATRDPETMSHVIPVVVHLTLLETQTDTDKSSSHAPSVLLCVISSVFLWPLCPSLERLVGAPCLNPLFGPSGGKRYHSSGILATPGPCVNSFQTHINTNTHTYTHTLMLALPTSPAKHT